MIFIVCLYLRGPGGQYSFVALQNPDIASYLKRKRQKKNTRQQWKKGMMMKTKKSNETIKSN